MKPSPEPIAFSQPLRDVVLVEPGSAVKFSEKWAQEREQASYERGRREGEEALSEQLVRQRAELLELQHGVLESLHRSIPEVRRDCENKLIELALAVSQKLVAGLPVSAEMVEAAVREALDQVEETTEFHVKLHSEDLELLRKANSPLLLPTSGVDRIHFQPSSDVSRGGCLVQTRFGIIDGRRETKIQLLKQALQS
ncbi:MAG: FliH/SctL family protein [Verrucomicrobiota bacterium]